ncbi:MAG: CCA tRNA nucleotidyltransferase, partial [Armatimonadetes bacterium]|nr:CCA tRNA nucleotidyltransferase [Armatimonadota bacterium]
MKKVTISHPVLRQLSAIAERHNKDIYLVGGYVRDLLLGNPGHDIDITIEGSGVEFAELVAKELRVKPIIFERFGTAMVMIGETQIEFVGTRKEEYLPDSRKPIVTEGTLLDDLRRRDFTVNAMAIRVNGSATGEIIDEFDGLGDLQRKLLRTPLDPAITYSDDPLRMMRAARFAAQLQFQLDPDSYDAIGQMRERIGIVSQERITAEFLKLLQADQPSIGLAILLKTGLLELVFPEVHRLEGVDLMNVGGIRYA